MNDKSKEFKVTAIEDGTVIDHIPAEALFQIISILELEKDPNQITFGTNLQSKRMGRKAIIKISNRYCADYEVDKIAVIAPMACVNTIKDYQVVEKRKVVIPSQIEEFVKCANPRCITNHQSVKTRFDVIERDSKVAGLRCRYCEKITTPDNMELI